MALENLRPVALRPANGVVWGGRREGVMAIFDEDPFAAPKKPAAHEIGEVLDAISVEELAERIDLLRQEILRLEEAMK